MLSKNFSKYLGVQLGCFNQPADRWYNTDITPHIFISRIYGLPYLLRSLNLMSDERYYEHRRNIFRNVHYVNLLKDCLLKMVQLMHIFHHMF